MNTKKQVKEFITKNPEVFQPLWATTKDLSDDDWDAIEKKWGEVMILPWDDDIYRTVQDEAYVFDWSQAQFDKDEGYGDTAPLKPGHWREYDFTDDDLNHDADRERNAGRRYGPYRD